MNKNTTRENRKRVNKILTDKLIYQLQLNSDRILSDEESYTKKLGMVFDVVNPDKVDFNY